jgi:hypothetical protein
MGMNFKLEFFDQTSNFWLVLGGMAVWRLAILTIARLRAGCSQSSRMTRSAKANSAPPAGSGRAHTRPPMRAPAEHTRTARIPGRSWPSPCWAER